MTCWDQLTSDQIGQILGLSPATARKRLERARARIATRLADTEHDTPPGAVLAMR